MCGLAGFIHPKNNGPEWRDTLKKMGSVLTHRGPDDEGIWFDPELGVGLAHRRLAVIDTSEKGHQPMLSASGRFVIVYNGEVYNFGDLRRELETVRSEAAKNLVFRGNSDTEVLVEAIDEWGVAETVPRLIGMFAFAVWDRKERVIHLVRDRFGIKPLYYGWCGKALVFGSELKSIRAYTGFSNPVDRSSLALLMRHGYLPYPYSIYENIYKLPPATLLTIGGKDPSQKAEPVAYWSVRGIAQRGWENNFAGSSEEAVERLDSLLGDAVQDRMIADVPLGAFLSGGIDSSTVVSLMQARSNRRIKTFTIGFPETEFNEAEHAKDVANHLGTDHTELYVTPKMALDVIPKLPALYDEPFGDSSQIPTFLLSQLARGSVTVCLSGDGGDELFAGYPRYLRTQKFKNVFSRFPYPIRKIGSKLLTAVSAENWARMGSRIQSILPLKKKPRYAGQKLYVLGEIFPFPDSEALYLDVVSHWRDPTSVVFQSSEPPTVMNRVDPWIRNLDLVQRLMFLDCVSYMPDDILTKLDRASMGVSLEARVPLLDHRVAEFAWSLPFDMKVRNGEAKWILKRVLYKYVPQALVDRPKKGFAVPVGSWIQGPLKDWAEDLLAEKRLQQEGFFNSKAIRKKWISHRDGECNWSFNLWTVLMFQAWLESQKDH